MASIRECAHIVHSIHLIPIAIMFNSLLLIRTIAPETIPDATPLLGALILVVFVIALALISLSRVFRRAGFPGWAAFVPIYNTAVLLRIGGLSPWWMLMLIVPIANVFVMLAVSVGVARAFRHSGAFAAGLWILPFVFYPILAFGKSEPKLSQA